MWNVMIKKEREMLGDVRCDSKEGEGDMRCEDREGERDVRCDDKEGEEMRDVMVKRERKM